MENDVLASPWLCAYVHIVWWHVDRKMHEYTFFKINSTMFSRIFSGTSIVALQIKDTTQKKTKYTKDNQISQFHLRFTSSSILRQRVNHLSAYTKKDPGSPLGKQESHIFGDYNLWFYHIESNHLSKAAIRLISYHIQSSTYAFFSPPITCTIASV